MTSLILMSMYFSLISSLVFVFNPLMLGIWTLLISLLVAIFISSILSSWFGLLVFLIYIGGLMVMFSYFTALSPNQQMNFGQMMKSSIVMFSQTCLLLSLMNVFTISSIIPSTPLMTLYTPENIPLLMYFALLLFFTLIAVVKITTKNHGPLRPFN